MGQAGKHRQSHQLRVGMISDSKKMRLQIPRLHHTGAPLILDHRIFVVQTGNPLVRIDGHQNRPNAGVYLAVSERY